jgi:hypothetical protein
MSAHSDLIGAVGVALLLVAFLLNLVGRLASSSRPYALLNVVGAGLSCYAAILIEYLPFVVLEGVWACVALVGMLRRPCAESE